MLIRLFCFSAVFLFLTNIISAQGYCIDPMDCEWISIDDFSVASLDHQNSYFNNHVVSGYGDFTDDPTLTTDFFPGGFYTWTAYTGMWANLGIWIDFNDNEDFGDAGECVYVSSEYFQTSFPSDNFTMPVDAPYGDFRMRVRVTISGEPQLTENDYCTDYWEGETHDYTVSIVEQTQVQEFTQKNLSSASLEFKTNFTNPVNTLKI